MVRMAEGVGAALDQYSRRTPGSRHLDGRAQKVLPGGDTRSVTHFEPYPTYMQSGHGSTLVDVDGNRYTDFLNNYTSMIHGHAHPYVNAAVRFQIENGMSFAAPHELQIRLAEAIVGRVPSVQQIRFCNSGTEAAMTAIQAARGATGRLVIAKMEGGYHGSYDHVRISSHIRSAGSGLHSNNSELSHSVLGEVLVLPYNDIEGAAKLLRKKAKDVAAILVEPILGSSGMIPATTAFLQALRDVSSEIGALLIFDEVMTFRLGLGGSQGIVDVMPDLTLFGKIIGGGLPIGAFGGSGRVMEQFAPEPKGSIPHSGTFNGHPSAMAGGIATLELLNADRIQQINLLGDRVRHGLNQVFIETGFEAVATGWGSLLDVHFGTTEVNSVRDAMATPPNLMAAIHLGLLDRGMFIAPRGMMNISTAVTEFHCDQLVAAWKSILTGLSGAGEYAGVRLRSKALVGGPN
jgi:glutamate-1-semialdehyde 2,1-aminomutase